MKRVLETILNVSEAILLVLGAGVILFVTVTLVAN